MCKVCYSQLFFLLLLSLFFVACRNNLEEKLMHIEQRVLSETEFGRQISDYMKSKNTRYILDQSLPFQSRYLIVEDTIHYNPKLNSSLEQWKQELLLGRPIRTILKFHEELHRTQVAYSERGAFYKFFRENGHIEEKLKRNSRMRHTFTLNIQDGDEGKLLRFAGSLVGYPILDLKTASEVVRQKMDEMNAINREKLLLDEIQAYLGSDIVTAKGVYSQLYEENKRGYENLPKMEFSDFSHLCDLVIKLYGFYRGNHEKVCEAVGKSKSIKDFQARVRSILWGVSSEELNRKVNDWISMKKEWARETIRIAEEVL